jgi:hypothetical protein
LNALELTRSRQLLVHGGDLKSFGIWNAGRDNENEWGVNNVKAYILNMEDECKRDVFINRIAVRL